MTNNSIYESRIRPPRYVLEYDAVGKKRGENIQTDPEEDQDDLGHPVKQRSRQTEGQHGKRASWNKGRNFILFLPVRAELNRRAVAGFLRREED